MNVLSISKKEILKEYQRNFYDFHNFYLKSEINIFFSILIFYPGIPKGQPGQSRANKRSPPDEVLEINFGQNTLPE